MVEGVFHRITGLSLALLLLLQYAPVAWLASQQGASPVCRHNTGLACPRGGCTCKHGQHGHARSRHSHPHAHPAGTTDTPAPQSDLVAAMHIMHTGYASNTPSPPPATGQEETTLCPCASGPGDTPARLFLVDKVILTEDAQPPAGAHDQRQHSRGPACPDLLFPDDIFHPPQPLA